MTRIKINVYFFIKILNFFVFPLVLLYWFIFRPKIFGAVCIIKHDDEILLAKHSYGKKRWGLPGGAVRKRETPKETIIREVKEEVGIELKELEEMGNFVDRTYYLFNTIYWFVAKVDNKNFESDTIEITEAKWFKPDNLPLSLGSVSQKIINMYKYDQK